MKQGNAEILEHARKRQVELKLFELRTRMEDEGYDEADCCRKSLEGVCGVIQEGNIIAPIGLL